MAKPNRVAGTLYVQRNGEVLEACGEWSYNLGTPDREDAIGTDGCQGYTEQHKAAFCEGKLRDRRDLRIADLSDIDGDTITLRLANGKTILYPDAWYSGSGTVNAATGEVEVKFSARRAEEV